MKEEGGGSGNTSSMAARERCLEKRNDDNGTGVEAGGDCSGNTEAVEANSWKESSDLSDTDSEVCVVSPCENGLGGATRKKVRRGLLKDQEKDGVVSRRFTRLAAAKCREEDARRKEVVKPVMNGKRGKLESPSSDDDTNITVKRIKIESAQRRRNKKVVIDAEEMKVGSPGVRAREMEITGNQVLSSKKLAASGAREKLNEKKIPLNTDEESHLVEENQEGFTASRDEIAKSTPAKEGALRVPHKGKKSGTVEKRQVAKKTGNPTEISEVNCNPDKTTEEEHYSSKKRKVHKKSGSSPALQNESRKSASSQKHGSHEMGTNPSKFSLTKKEHEDGDDIINVVRTTEMKGNNTIKKSMVPGNRFRSTEKQKLRDQIKDILLSSGWTIDLRPRKTKNYFDSVYVSPEGTGYWSITKAYYVYQGQFKGNNDTGVSDAEEPERKSKASNGGDDNLTDANSSFSAIPDHLLSILKRKVVNKRRSKKELEESSCKHGDRSGGKRSKESSLIKRKAVVASEGQPTQGRKKKNNRGRALLARNSNQGTDSDVDDYIPYNGKRTVLAWMIESGAVPANAKVKYMNNRRTRTILEGSLKRDGILCSCCTKVYSITEFEVHAGGKYYQSYQNIILDDSDLSLSQCQLHAWKNQEQSKLCGFYSVEVENDPNDDTCGICGDGGDLICCDGCPSTFHLICLGIEMLPPGDWHCSNCSCRFCGVVDDNIAQGNDCGSQLLSCIQCEKKYHLSCVVDDNNPPVDHSNASNYFCGKSCQKIFGQLRKLLGVRNDLEDGFSWSIVQRFDDDYLASTQELPRKAECNAKIAVALAVMDECFLPIVDQRSGVNLVHNVVYNCGSNLYRLNFSGFYTFLLERGDEIISAASIRIHGTKVAEMPFIGTRNMYRRQGMCRRLLNAIESALISLDVERLVIPAISELEDTWTTVFEFKPLNESFRQELKSINLLVFPGTGLLVKPLLKKEKRVVIFGDENSGFSGRRSPEDVEIEINEKPVPLHSDELLVSSSCTDLAIDNATIHQSLLVNGNLDLKSNTSVTCTTTEVSFNPSEVPSASDCNTCCQSPRITKGTSNFHSDFSYNELVEKNKSLHSSKPGHVTENGTDHKLLVTDEETVVINLELPTSDVRNCSRCETIAPNSAALFDSDLYAPQQQSIRLASPTSANLAVDVLMTKEKSFLNLTCYDHIIENDNSLQSLAVSDEAVVLNPKSHISDGTICNNSEVSSNHSGESGSSLSALQY